MLNSCFVEEVIVVVVVFDEDDGVGVIVVIGFEKVFVVGVDIKEMEGMFVVEMFEIDYFGIWYEFVVVCILVIVVVLGFVFGGGCELVMMCDIILVVDIVIFG